MEITHQDLPPPDSPDAPLSHHVKPQRKVTPTERKPHLPSSPSSSERKQASSSIADELPREFIEAMRDYKTRGDVSKLTSLPLSYQDYTRLLPKLEAIFRRVNYDARRELVTIRIPSRLHETFSLSVSNAIFNALSEIGRNHDNVLPLISKIAQSGNGDINMIDSNDEGKGPRTLTRSPDGQFHYVDAEFPNTVIEVAYSQRPKELATLAEEYIYNTWGEIKAVLGFALNKSDGTTISVWKPLEYTVPGSHQVRMKKGQFVQSEPFRTADGSPINQDRQLVLELYDFLPDEDCKGCLNIPISIPYSKLYDALVTAEAHFKSRGRGSRPSRASRGVKRDRKPSD